MAVKVHRAPEGEEPRGFRDLDFREIVGGFGTHGITRCLQLHRESLVANAATLRAVAELAVVMAYFYLCDRTTFFRETDKHYSRDFFAFFCLLLVAFAGYTSLGKVKRPTLLNRDQTEEWKGWMQVLFLLYHYFAAAEMYNSIRLYIAAYVWMTGYGNFAYYYRTRDYSASRLVGMLWRLNFLVVVCCMLLRNSYTLYYICPMHTLYTLAVIATVAAFDGWNGSARGLLAKLGAAAAVVAVVWGDEAAFYRLWRPLQWLVGYENPARPGKADPLHEWFFRSGLDRFVWIVGMLCAFLKPQAEAALAAVDGLAPRPRAAAYGGLAAGILALFVAYKGSFYDMDKFAYNRHHPYTSWIPICLFIALRNLHPTLRAYTLGLFAWLGKITLETYIAQFHIWLSSSVPDGQPKHLLALIPEYPLLNFALCTAIYVYTSHRIFRLTVALKDAACPDDLGLLLKNFWVMGVYGGVTYAAGAAVNLAFRPAAMG